jgi:FkbM family methyltransferase
MNGLALSDLKADLAEVNAKLGNYEWMWMIMRSRARKHGGMFPERAFKFLRKFGNPNKPYFIGTNYDGTKFVGDYRDLYSVLLVVDPAFNRSFIDFIVRRIEGKGGNFIDVGANMGEISASVARRINNRGEVIAFEPLPPTAVRTAATFALNNLTNAKLFKAAVSNSDGEIQFFHTPGHSDRASVHHEGAGEEEELTETKVPCWRLDTITSALGKPALIKIDIEGHEPAAIAGAHAVITEHTPDIIFEYVHNLAEKMGWKAPDVANEIKDCGGNYNFFTMHGRENDLASFPPSDESIMYNIYCSADPQTVS